MSTPLLTHPTVFAVFAAIYPLPTILIPLFAVITMSGIALPPSEFAGHASFRSFDPSDPLSPLQLDACVDWNADTGATSHMTNEITLGVQCQCTVY